MLLPVQGVTVADLEAAFGLEPGTGLGVKLFDFFDLRLMAGTFTTRGIEGAVFKVEIADVPLPELSGAYADFTVDFSDPNEVRLPFHGQFTLPEAVGPGATIRVPRSRPLVLILRADGSIGLKGRVELLAPGGARYAAEVSLDDPNYAFALSAAGVEVPFLDSFAELLPDDAAGLVPATTDAAQLAFATRALESYARAFFDFSAAAAANAPVPADLEDGGDRPPGDTGAALARIVEAWAFAARSPAVQVIADDVVGDLLARLSRVGSGATEIVSSTEHLAAAARMRAVLEDPAFDAEQPGARARLDSALVELERAVIRRSREPGAAASLTSVAETTRLLLDVEAARQLLGQPGLSPLLQDAVRDLWSGFLGDYTRSLGVVAGQFDPAGNPRIATLNRYLAVETTHRLIEALAALQLLGLANTFSEFGVPGDELFTQLTARGAAAVRAELAAAELAGDARTFLDLLADLLDFEVARQIGLLPGAPAAVAVLTASGLPDPFDLEGLMSRYAAVRTRDVTLELGAATLADSAREVARINRMVSAIPASLALAVAPAERALERLDTALGTAVPVLPVVDDPGLLAEFIAAGTNHARLTRRLEGAPTPGAPWETVRLVAGVDRLVALAPVAKPWAELHRAARLLLGAADELGLEAEDPTLTIDERTDRIAARRDNLVQAARLVGAARGVAATIWTETEAALAAAGRFGIDALLPGAIEVENVAGSFAYNRRSQAWSGSLSGAVRLPGLLGGATLTLQQATFSSSGEFEAVAFGSLSGVPLGSLTGAIDVPARRPLRIRHELFRPLEVAGSARLELSNGFFFEGYLDFRDPVYRFGAAAGGVRFDFADRLIGYTPSVTLTLPFSFNAQNEVVVDPAFEVLTAETATALDDWFRSLGATLEPVAGLLTPPPLGAPGAPPAFQAPAFTFEFDGINAAFNGLIAGAALELDAAYAEVLEAAKEDLARSAREMQRAPVIADNAAVYLQTLRRAEEVRRINERLRATLEKLAEEQVQGIDTGDVADDPRVREFHAQLQAQADELFTHPLTTNDRRNARRVAALAIDSDATAQELGELGGFFLNRLPAFYASAFGAYLQSLGLNPAFGTVADPAVFTALTRRELAEAFTELSNLQAEAASVGAEGYPPSFNTALATVGMRRRALAIAEYGDTAPENWERRAALLREIIEVTTTLDALEILPPGDHPRLNGTTGPVSLAADGDQALDQAESVALVRDADLKRRGSEPFYEFLAVLRRITDRDVPEAVLASIRREVQANLDRLLPEILGLLPVDAIPDSQRIFRDLIAAADAAAEFNLTAELDRIGKIAIPNFTVKLAAIAEAQRAWWVLSDYARLLREATERQAVLADQTLRVAIEGSIMHTLEFGRRVGAALAADVAARISAGVEPFELRLPGDLVVHRVFGDFVFERNIPRFTATFGGELEFPEIETFLEINAATISTDGSFALDVATRGPVEAGGDSLEYTMGLVVTGSAGGVLQNAAGTGTLSVTKAGAPPESPPDEYTVAVAFIPLAVAPSPVFRLATTAEGIFIFDTQFVLFEAEASLEFTREARTGRFRVGGTAGTLAKREDFTRADVTRADFRLLFEEVGLGFAYREDGFAATLEGGRVVLDPELFFGLGSVNCDDTDDPAPPGTGQAPFAALLTPLTVDVSLADPAAPVFSFQGGPSGTDLAFGNLGFEIPGMPGVQVDVCNLGLRFPASGIPVLADLDARLTIPLEGGETTIPLGGGPAVDSDPDIRVARTRLNVKDWTLDGFPSELSVTFDNDLEILPEGPLTVTLIGPTTLAFGFENTADTITTFLGASGTVRVALDADVLLDLDANAQAGGAVAAIVSAEFGVTSTFAPASSSFTIGVELAIDSFSVCGRFRLGGANGLEITGVDGPASLACLTLSTERNLLDLGGDPLTLALSGRFGSEQFAFFILDNARFTFDAAGAFGFAVAGFGFEVGESIKLLGEDLLPVQLTAARLDFVNDTLPLLPPSGQPGLLELQNLVFTLSGSVNIAFPPSPDAAAPGEGLPRLFGAVDDLVVAFPQGFEGVPTFSLDGFALTLENLSIGDLAGLTGGVAFGNLNDLENLFFAGQLGGGFNGVGVTVIFAATLKGPIGLCLDVNAGPAGIPIDGGSLGGVLLTGAKGGVSFGNTFVDPCDFRALLQLGDDGKPTGGSPPELPIPPAESSSSLAAASATTTSTTAAVPASLLVGLSWEDLARKQSLHERLRTASREAPAAEPEPTTAPLGSATMEIGALSTTGGGPATTADDDPPELDERCPTGDCPPPTINIFCERHPSNFESPSTSNYDGAYAGAVIFKFSSLQPAEVDDILAAIGLNPANLQGTPESLALQFSAEVRAIIDALLEPVRPCSPVDDPDCPLDAAFREAFDQALADFEGGLRALVEAGLTAALDGNRPLIDALYEVAYAGVPCVDFTILLEGTISHTVVSSVASISGGVATSTTGTSGIFGGLNLLGIPVGTVDLYYSFTDRGGQPNPSLCGGVFLGIGPLELGAMDFVFECEDCITGILEALAGFVGGVATDGGAQIDALLRQWIAEASGQPLASITAPLPAHFGPTQSAANGDEIPPAAPLLPRKQQIAVLAQLYNVPALLEALQGAGPAAIAQLEDRVWDLIVGVALSVNPTLSFCGEVAPKIFGIPLGGELLGANLFYGRVDDGGTRYDELASQIRFSPSWVLLNYGLVIGSSGLIPPFIPGIDQANMGFATRVESFTAESLRAFFGDPIGGTLDRMQEVVENSLFTFGYQLEPFGLRLANGQARIILPQLDHHPNNPARVGGAWQLPPAPDFATRRELLFAAIDADRLQDPTWRGRPGQLGELFTDPGLATRMNTKDLVRDYFPHGGILGASRLLFPRPVTDLPPPELLRVFDATRSLQERWNDLAFTFENYLVATTEVGKLALYFPAPNPPTLLWDDPANPPDALGFVEALKTTDVGAILASGRNVELYPFDELFMSGEAGLRILGLPLADGEIELDGAAGLFRLEANVPPGSWLDLVLGTTASLEFQITNPRYVEQAGAPGQAFLPPEQALLPTPAGIFFAAGENLVGKTGPALDAALTESLQMVIDTVPRVSLEAAVDFVIPPELGDILSTDAAASLSIFGFSPGFDPAFVPADPLFDPLNPDPYTLARRRGGTGFEGALTFGYFPAGIEIDVPEASLAFLLGTADNVMPAFAGLLRVDTFALPGGYVFEDGLLRFNSQPAIGGDFLEVRGRTSPIDLGPFLQVGPLDPPAPGEPTRLGASFRVTATASPVPAVQLGIDPARATIPMLGDSLAIDIYGGQDPVSGEFTPFTFSSVPGQAWEATLRISGALQVRDPFNLAGPVLFEVETAGGVPFLATMNGTGLDEFTLRVTIPNGVTVRAFPGQVTQTEWTVGDANATCLLIQSNGRIYLDSGTRTFPLAGGALEATGRVELGFEPVTFAPVLDSSPSSLAFGSVAAFGGGATQTVFVRNLGFGRMVVDATITAGGAHYTVSPNRLILGPGQNSSVVVRYLPQTLVAHPGTLALTSNGGDAAVPLSGAGAGAAVYNRSPTSLAFGSVILGTQARLPIVVTNSGTAPLSITGASATGPFTVAPASATIAAGATRIFDVTFTPTAAGAASGTLTFATNLGNQTVPLSGAGDQPGVLWRRQRHGGPDLRGGHQILANVGWVVGDEGTVLRTTDSGRTWFDLGAGREPWRDIAFAWVSTTSTSSPDELRGFIVSAEGRIEVTQDAGGTWSAFELSRDADLALAEWRFAGRRDRTDFVFAGALGNQGIIATELKGAWNIVQPAGAAGINGVAFLSEVFGDPEPVRTGVAVGDNGTLLRSTDGGGSWQSVARPAGVPAGTRFVSVSASQQPTLASRRFLVVGQPDILMTSADGLTWTVLAPPASRRGEFTAGEWTGNTVAQLGTSEGQIFRMTGSGAGFSEQFLQPAVPLRKVLHNRQNNETGGNTSDIWIVGDQGTILRRPTPAADAAVVSYSVDPMTFAASGLGNGQFTTVTVTNGGAATVSVKGTLTGAAAGSYQVFPADASVGPGETITFVVTFRPATSGGHPATLTFAENSTNVFSLPLDGVGGAGRWVLMNAPSSEAFVGAAQLDDKTFVLAEERTIRRTTDSGATWSTVASNLAAPLAALSFANATHGVVGGGTGSGSVPSLILSTTNGGVSWTSQTAPTTTGVADLHYVELGATDRRATGITRSAGATSGQVIESGNNATLWSDPNSRAVDGSAVWRIGDVRFATTVNELLRAPTPTGAFTTLFSSGGLKPALRDIFFVDANRGWVVGTDGAFYVTTSGGATSGAWTNRTSPALGDIHRVVFIDESNGYLATETAADTRILASTNGGAAWTPQLLVPKRPGAPMVRGFTNRARLTPVAYGTGGGLWRFEAGSPPPQAYAYLPSRIDLGSVGIGQSRLLPVPVQNLGFANLELADVALDALDSPTPFSAEFRPETLPPGSPVPLINVHFRPTALGEFRATLRVMSDAYNGEVEIEVVGRGVAPVATVLVETRPTGGTITVGGTGQPSGTVFNVVESGGTGSSINWNRGTTRTLSAPATRTLGGVSHRFSHWTTGGATNSITHTAGSASARLIAHYVPTTPTPAAPPAPPTILPNPCAAVAPPADVPQGPWMKVSQATLKVRDLTGAPVTAVQGSLLLSLTQANGTLATSAFRVLAPAAVGGFETVEVTAGSWRFDLGTFPFNVGGADQDVLGFRFQASNPGLELFERPAAPPGTFEFIAAWNPQTPFAPPLVAGQFATNGELPIIPSVLQFGPSNVDFAVSPAVGLGVSGTVRAIARPDIAAFYYNSAFNYRLGTPSPQLGTGTTTLADFGFIRVRGDAESRFSLFQNTSGVFTVTLANLLVDGWLSGGEVQRFGASVSTNGLIEGELFIPSTGATTGPFRIVPVNTSNVAIEGAATFSVNVFQHAYVFSLPRFQLRSVNGFWPNGAFVFPGLSIDTASDFEQRFALPSAIAGIALPSGAISRNHALLERKNGLLGLRVRSEQDLVFGDFRLRLKATGPGALSGTLSGTAVEPFSGAELGSVSMSYDSGGAPFQFEKCFGFFLGDFRLRFGSGGAGISGADCD